MRLNRNRPLTRLFLMYTVSNLNYNLARAILLRCKEKPSHSCWKFWFLFFDSHLVCVFCLRDLDFLGYREAYLCASFVFCRWFAFSSVFACCCSRSSWCHVTWSTLRFYTTSQYRRSCIAVARPSISNYYALAGHPNSINRFAFSF